MAYSSSASPSPFPTRDPFPATATVPLKFGIRPRGGKGNAASRSSSSRRQAHTRMAALRPWGVSFLRVSFSGSLRRAMVS